MQYFDFEKEIELLESSIENLRHDQSKSTEKISTEIKEQKKKLDFFMKKLYGDLTPWQTCQVARHPDRPQALDYIHALLSDAVELHGDRKFADDKAIVAFLGWLDHFPVVVIGHQKGKDTNGKLYRNFGMPRPEGYRKALRVMKLAEKFGMPVITLVDTPGAYPGIGAEERNQSEAIGYNLLKMAGLKVPIIATIIGEGGSGGALALAIADHVMMLEHAIYSVISPEGCAAILWKNGEKMEDAAGAMRLTAKDIIKLKLIDEVVKEPIGGSHRDPDKTMSLLKDSLTTILAQMSRFNQNTLVERRLERWRDYGYFVQGSG